MADDTRPNAVVFKHNDTMDLRALEKTMAAEAAWHMLVDAQSPALSQSKYTIVKEAPGRFQVTSDDANLTAIASRQSGNNSFSTAVSLSNQDGMVGSRTVYGQQGAQEFSQTEVLRDADGAKVMEESLKSGDALTPVLDGNGNTIALMKESWVADRGQGLAHENREFYAPTGDNVLLGRVEMDWKNSADANHAEETITVTRNPAQPITL